MINIYKHDDVLDLIKFVNSMKVVTMQQIETYFKNKGITDNRLEKILTIATKSGRIFQSDSQGFVVNQKHLLEENYFNIYMSNYKLSWIFCELSSVCDSINIECKYPCKAFLYNTKSPTSIHIFEISDNNLEKDCIDIETNFNIPITQKHPIDSVIILDSVERLDEIYLSKAINVLAFAVINKTENNNAEVLFYNRKGERIQVKSNG